MTDNVAIALEMTERLRESRGYRELAPAARAALDQDLVRLQGALSRDPYTEVLGGLDLADRLQNASRAAPPKSPAEAPARTLLPQQSGEIGRRAADVLEAVDFPGFVSSLIHGTFQAIVDASSEQIRRYAELVNNLTQTLESFTEDNVSLNLVRDELAAKHPADLVVELPAAGKSTQPRLIPRSRSEGSSPAWLERYQLKGQPLTVELTEGALLKAGRVTVGEERLQTLATLVLMGINRVVVNEGDLRAKIQFHAVGKDVLRANPEQQSLTIAQRSGAGGAQMMVSTVKANAQAEASIKADLMGEVRVSFRSETFPLERFADTQAIQLLSRHARWKGEAPAAAPAPASPAPPSSAPNPAGGTPGEGGAP